MTVLDLRSELIRLLKEDEEFRYTVAGLLGYQTILEELRKLREDFLLLVRGQEKRWEKADERFATLEEELRKLREDFNAFMKAQEKRWEKADERFATLEEELRKLREDFLLFVREQEERWEENNRRWEENNRRWEENAKRWEENNRRIARIEMELGSISESLYCRYVSEDLERELTAAGERILSKVRNADFDGVEIDLAIITDRAAYIVEVKTKPTKEDVDDLLAKAEAARKTAREVVPILTGALIGRDVESYAKGRGVQVRRY